LLLRPAAGNRSSTDGGLANAGTNARVWSGAVSGTNATYLNFNSTTVNPANATNRANGFSVRCVQEFTVINIIDWSFFKKIEQNI